MEFKIECPWCNQHYSVDESLVGQKVECSVCEKEFVVRKPNDTLQKGNKDTQNNLTDYFSKKEKTKYPKDSPNQNQARKVFIPPKIIPRVIVALSSIVIVLIVLSAVYYTKIIPDKQYKNGLKA